MAEELTQDERDELNGLRFIMTAATQLAEYLMNNDHDHITIGVAERFYDVLAAE